MALKLYIQQTLTYNIKGDRIYYEGNTPQNLQIKEHKLAPFPSSRSFPNNPGWYDVTGFVSDLHKLKLSWTENKDSNGLTIPGASQLQKSASGTLTFEEEAYRLMKQWLIDDVSAPLNSIDVRIEDTACKDDFLGYTIKATDLRWCEDQVCTFDTTLKQKDERLNCIKSTLITNNHTGMFQTVPANNKKHPRFSYCNEQRPNGIMIMVWWQSAIIIVPTLWLLVPIMFALNGIFAVVNVIVGAVNALIKLLTGKPLDTVNWQTIPYFDFDGMREALGAYFVESGGCGREHPAPLIRDYIQNVCDYCNVKVDGDSAPIFFAQTMDVASSRGMLKDVHNPHYNACYLHATVKRGIRRFKSVNALRALHNNTDYYIEDNSPLLTLDMFLDELKQVYNAEWRLKNGKLYFQRKDYFLQSAPLYDFTANGADRFKLLEGLCFEWNELKYPAYTKGIYTSDAADTCGNEAEAQMNAYIQHGNVDENPNFESVREINVPYGATRFRLDGVSEDYLFDAMQVVVNGSFFTPFLGGFMFDVVGKEIQEYGDYALLLKDETCTLPKILVWDGQSYDNARCIRPHSARGLVNSPVQPPARNYKYDTGKEWWDQHPDNTFVRGSGLTLPPTQPGYYLVTDFFGAREIKKPALLVNYPMYFEPGYENTLWDWFHWIDDPRKNPVMNMNWQARLELCCDDLKHLELFGDLTDIKLGQKVLLPLQYYNEGKVNEIEVSYDTSEDTGPYIQLKGTV